MSAAQPSFNALRRNERITRRAQCVPSTRCVPPCDVTWTVLRRVTMRTLVASFGPKSGASESGVSESRSPPTISTGTDAGSLRFGNAARLAVRLRPVVADVVRLREPAHRHPLRRR